MFDLSKLTPTDVFGVNRIRSVPGIVSHRKCRDRWAFCFKSEGTTEYVCASGTVKNDAAHACLLPRGSEYSWVSRGGECLLVDFEADVTYPEVLSFGISDVSAFVPLFSRLEAAFAGKGPKDRFNCLSLLCRMLAMLVPSEGTYTASRRYEKIRPAVERMRSGFSDPDFSVGSLGAAVGISEIYFRKIFTEYHKMSPASYLICLRMKKAAQLLSTETNSVSSVAALVGYRSLYHFSRAFKAHYGVPPSEYGKE